MSQEVRSPKVEGRKKAHQKEIRRPKPDGRNPNLLLRVSGFLPFELPFSDFGIRPSFDLRSSGFGFCLTLFFLSACARTALAQTNISGEEIPPLLPPRGELPPSFSEQYGLWLVLGGFFLLVVIAAAIWFLTRPKPAKLIPPAVEARATLESLRQRPEDGAVLTRVSQVLRRYISGAFEMPSEELTTTEFCQALARVERVGPDLSCGVARFLKDCDIRKFAPAPASSNALVGQAVPQAFKLIDQTEARLAQLRQAAAMAPPVASNRPKEPSEANEILS